MNFEFAPRGSAATYLPHKIDRPPIIRRVSFWFRYSAFLAQPQQCSSQHENPTTCRSTSTHHSLYNSPFTRYIGEAAVILEAAMARSKVSKQPSHYWGMPFHIIRFLQFCPAFVVAIITIFFVFNLQKDHFSVPWTFVIVRAPLSSN